MLYTETLEQVRKAALDHPLAGPRELARVTGISYSTLHKYLKAVRSEQRQVGIEAPDLPSGDLPLEKIIERRRESFVLRKRAQEARRLVPVKVKMDGPIGITWFGDPHIDDDGCNWPQLERDIATVRKTKAMFAANIGDGHNNWAGRLSHLYSQQTSSASEAWRLVEWFISELPWLIFLDGNHGAWSGDGNPVKWMLDHCHTLHDQVDVRIGLEFPNRTSSVIYARHDFPGHSQWNVVHGLAKAATFGGYSDSLLVAGHRHVSGYSVVKNPSTGVVSHLLRVAGYKEVDPYAREGFFREQRLSASAVSIFDPERPVTDPHHVTVFHDVEHGADYLKYLRSKK